MKSLKWSYENEFRFITIGDEENIERLKHYSKETVVEFLIGSRFPEKLKLNFIEEVRKAFPSKIPIYQVYPAISGYGLIKTVIA